MGDLTIAVFWHEDMLKNHDLGRGVFDTLLDPGFLDVLEPHPENADRLRNIRSILCKGPISPYITWHPGRRAQLHELLSFHTQDYLNKLIEADTQGGKELCTGTKLAKGSWDIALLAAGTTLDAMKSILEGRKKLAYALVRPPGHHAQPTQADGYCFLNNAGLAVHLSISAGIKRIAVVDIDVHYGNGTAEGFYDRDDVLTVSLHMKHGSWGPSHPQTGLADEAGTGKGLGYNMNVPLPIGTGDMGYENAVQEMVVPILRRFKPEIIVMAIGQDSSAFDPNGRMCLTMAGYRRLGQIIRGQADLFCGGRLLLVQEGGYHITYSAYCLHATLEGVLNLPSPLLADPLAYYPEEYESTVAAVSQMKQDWIKAFSNPNANTDC